MNSVAVVSLASLEVCLIYSGPANQGSYGGDWGSPQVTVHLEVPEDLDPQCIMAVRADDGTIILQADPTKVQARIAQAWTALRTERNARLAASDWTQLQDAHLSAEKKSAWADYRQALRDLPDELANTVPEGAGPPDLFDWPLDPTNVVQAPVTGSRLTGILGQV